METVLDIADVEPDAIVAQHGPFVLLANSVIAVGEPSYDEWEAATKWAQKAAHASPFWAADLLIYGEQHYGEQYTQAIEMTGKSAGTLQNQVYTANAVPKERRRKHSTMAHCQEVAALPAEAQIAWLKKAEDDDLTVKQLRHAIKVEKAVAAGHALERWVMVACTDDDDQQALLSKLTSELGRTCKPYTKEIA